MCRLTCGKLQKTRERIERADPRQIAHISLYECFDVVAIPGHATSLRSAGERRRIATSHNPLGKLISQTTVVTVPEPLDKQGIEKGGGDACDLALGQRMQPQDLQASCQ